jgi:hypothetical protein
MNAARHPLPDELELYVLGALDGDTAARLERHVHHCGPCAAALTEEARLETTLRALVPAVGRTPAKVVRLPAPAAAARAVQSGPVGVSVGVAVGDPQGARSRKSPTPTPMLTGRTGPSVTAPRPRASLSGPLAAAAAIVLAVWGLEGGRGAPAGRAGVAAASMGDAPLVCEAEDEAPLCPWPGALASVAPVGDNIYRAPVGGSCAIQSRMP